MAGKDSNTIPRSYSRYNREAVRLLGRLIRSHRIERRLSVEALATRAGISRDMMHRIEKGDPRCAIGLMFEAAAIVEVVLFDSEPGRLAEQLAAQEAKLRLLPKAVHQPRTEVKDDF